MAIEFRREIRTSSFLDPMNDFAEKSLPIEFRYDPLTMDMGVLVEFRVRRPEKPDLSQLIAKYPQMNCPFCPELVDKVTPKFVPAICPEGRIKVGEATVFPNPMPYMPYSTITALGAEHFVGLTDFTSKMLSDAFLASQSYFEKVYEYAPEAKYCCIMWNYMPPANSSQLHPHLQVLASYSPLAYHQKLLEASQEYRNETGANYWSDFIAEERRLQERYIATLGNTVWLTSFVSRSGFFDALAIFQGRDAITSLSLDDIDAFSQGLTRVFKYMDDGNFYSFNLCLYSGIPKEDAFWTQARIIPRLTAPPLGISDVGNLTLLGDTRTIMRSPELVCQELKAYFG
jgi:UDPglucose--hexose-1-phosphate uridylyltransferase